MYLRRICNTIHRYAKANNKYMDDYDKNKETSHFKYWDVNNLYGWAVSQKLSLNDFKWVEDSSEFDGSFIFFLSGFSFTNIHNSLDGRGRGRVSLYHIYSLHRHLDISRTIAADSSPLHIASSWTQIGHLWFLSESR